MFNYDYLAIAKRLIDHWRAAEALEWIDKVDERWEQDKRSLRIKALELIGNHKEAQDERISWLYQSLNPEIYGEILKHSKPESKESVRINAIKEAFAFSEPHTALAFLMQIQEFEEGTKFIYLRQDELDGGQYYILRPAAKLLQNTDVFAATLLYGIR